MRQVRQQEFDLNYRLTSIEVVKEEVDRNGRQRRQEDVRIEINR